LNVWFLARGTVTPHPVDELKELLGSDDGIVWVDLAATDAAATDVLSDVFGFHPLAVRDCLERNQVPKVHVYDDHVFVVLHAPVGGKGGHVHYAELDQFIGPGYLVTVHGPLNPAVDPDAAMVEVNTVLRRLEAGRLRPDSSSELSFAVVAALAGRLRNYISTVTAEVWRFEQMVTGDRVLDPEEFLEQMFRARHGLLTVRTMAALSREVYGRMAGLAVVGRSGGQAFTDDLTDQFGRLRAMAHNQMDYLQGTIDFHQARTNTKMTIAAERLAVIAAVTLPITALSSILGMNFIVNDHTRPLHLAVALVVMAIMSTLLLVWAKRKGWW
jgi:Mg2+ and Co2+ transporter CorA